jgi:7-alpha-hydroxysteroid dehydrogenase
MIKQTKETGISGSILNLSSIASLRTRPGLMGYSISSAALDQMTRTMAVALAPYNIRVNAISFGSVMSESLKNSLKEDINLRDEIVKNTPLGRIAPATEIAQAAQFLCSEASNFITGEIMTIDGGRSLLDPVKIGAH